MSTRADTLRSALVLGQELCELLAAPDMDADAIRTRLQQRRDLIAACDPTNFSEDERALARALVALDARVIAICEDRSRLVATTLVRARPRMPMPTTPGRLLTDFA